MTATISKSSTLVQDRGEEIRQQLGLDQTPQTIAINDLSHVFETGVITSARITAERFSFTFKLSDLGIVPTDTKRKDKVMTAINAVLRTSQRGSLLPKDEMWYMKDGKKLPIPMPEVSERRARMMFPARYDDMGSKAIANPNFATWHAVPINGMTFVPFRLWDEWNKQFQEAKQFHLNAAKIIVENYDRLRSASIRHYLQIALDVYNRLQKTAPDQITTYVVNSDTGEQEAHIITALDWIRRWKRLVMNAWPTKEQILSRYTVEEKFYWAPKPSRVKVDEAMVRYIAEMDSRNWDGDKDAWAQWLSERERIIEGLWEDLEYANKYATSIDEKMAIMSIARQVERTQQSQSHEMTVAYIKTIVERAESVFINFLGLMRNEDAAFSASQINAILRVSSMIQSMSKGVGTLDSIKAQAEKIEKYINDNKSLAMKAKEKKGKAAREAMPELPTIIASAVSIIRQEAESLIGREARYTNFSDADPGEILSGIMEERAMKADRAARTIIADYDAVPVESAVLTYASPVTLEDEQDEMAAVRRVR